MLGEEPLEDWLIGDRMAAPDRHTGRGQARRVLPVVQPMLR